MSDIKNTILLADIIFPIDFHKQLDNLNEEKEMWDFFLKNDFVYCISFITKDKEFGNTIYKGMIKDCMQRVTSGSTMFLDSEEIMERIKDIKRKVSQGFPFHEFCNFFIETATALQHGGKNGKFLEGEEKAKLAASTYCNTYNKEDNAYGGFCFVSTDGRLINRYPENLVRIAQQRLRNLNKKKKTQIRNPIDSRLRHECFKRDGYKCVECGATNKEKELHADHIIAKSQDGSDELDNLQTLCYECNLAKSDKSFKGGKQEVKNGNHT